jgi:hypothetical protein
VNRRETYVRPSLEAAQRRFAWVSCTVVAVGTAILGVWIFS